MSSKFGYEVLGTYGTRSISNVIAGSVYTPISGGVGQSITVGLKQLFGDWEGSIKCALYYESDRTLVANGVTEERSIDLTDVATWYTFNFVGTKPIIANSTAYIIVAWGEPAIDSVRAILLKDYQDDPVIGLDHPEAYNGFPSPITLVRNADKASIFCTYEDVVAGGIDLLPGEQRQLDVALVPIAGPGVPVMQHIYMVDNDTGDGTAECVAFCPVTNTGPQEVTCQVTINALLYDVFPEPQLKPHTETLIIPPGATVLARYYFHWRTGARGEIWAVGDWGEQTPKMACTFGYSYRVKNSAEVACTLAGANHATFRFAQYGMCNDWTFTCYTPYLAPFEQYLQWEMEAKYDAVSGIWTCIHATGWGLLPGRNYEVRGEGGAIGGAWREDWARFKTL